MSAPTPDDELLSILLINLRNAAKTFGEGTPPYESIRTTIEEHVRSLKAQGQQTNLTDTRQVQKSPLISGSGGGQQEGTARHPVAFQNLAFRPKPSG